MASKKLVPNKWYVGLQYERSYRNEDKKIRQLGFFTFEENGKINSESSWNNWRDKKLTPVEFENKFIEGWKIEEDYNQRFGQSTRKMFILTHPITKYSFELDLAQMVKILKNVVIKDYVLQGKFAFTRNKSIISEEEYKKVKEVDDVQDLTHKTIKPGDIVYIGHDSFKGRKSFVYLGKKYVLESVFKYGECNVHTQFKKFTYSIFYPFDVKDQDGFCSSDLPFKLLKSKSFKYPVSPIKLLIKVKKDFVTKKLNEFSEKRNTRFIYISDEDFDIKQLEVKFKILKRYDDYSYDPIQEIKTGDIYCYNYIKQSIMKIFIKDKKIMFDPSFSFFQKKNFSFNMISYPSSQHLNDILNNSIKEGKFKRIKLQYYINNKEM